MWCFFIVFQICGVCSLDLGVLVWVLFMKAGFSSLCSFVSVFKSITTCICIHCQISIIIEGIEEIEELMKRQRCRCCCNHKIL